MNIFINHLLVYPIKRSYKSYNTNFINLVCRKSHSDFTHISNDNSTPVMVDVGDKKVTRRKAVAQCYVRLPEHVTKALRRTDGTAVSAKGPVFTTSIIAGVLGVKQTHNLIPFCHPLPIENAKVDLKFEGDDILVNCEVAVSHKTGVEMEALTGCTIAALTVYDMCKALSHDIVITDIKLVSKIGGKSDVNITSNHNTQINQKEKSKIENEKQKPNNQKKADSGSEDKVLTWDEYLTEYSQEYLNEKGENQSDANISTSNHKQINGKNKGEINKNFLNSPSGDEVLSYDEYFNPKD